MSRGDDERRNILTIQEGWNFIQHEGISKIREIIRCDMQGKITTETYSKLYTTVYNLSVQRKPHNYQKELYQLFGECIVEYLEGCVAPLFDHKSGLQFLEELVKQWKYHKFMTRWMCALFMYLDRHYVQRKNLKPTAIVCKQKFRERIFDSHKFQALDIALKFINEDREKPDSHRELLCDFVKIFTEIEDSLSLYVKLFEKPFLKETRDYYILKRRKLLNEHSCPSYLKEVEYIIETETALVIECLHGSTLKKVLKVLHMVLLREPQEELMAREYKGAMALFQDRETEDLNRMYRLYKDSDGLNLLAKYFQSHIQGLGKILGSRAEQETDLSIYIENLMATHISQLELVTECFKDHQLFHKVLKVAFEEIVNRNVGDFMFQELLSTYCDYLLRKNGKQLTEEGLSKTQDNVLQLFSYIRDKDVFSEVYRNSLAKRLLSGSSASDSAERAFISRLKFTCGSQFTSKLEGMINDLGMSSDTNQKFKSYLRKNNYNVGFDFSIMILTNGFWPCMIDNDEAVTLPQTMARPKKIFEEWYIKMGAKRKIQFINNKGTVVLTRQFTHNRVTLDVSQIQACLLLTLNLMPKLKIQSLIKMLKISPQELKRQLKPLCSKNFKVIQKIPPKGYNVEHEILINENYNPKSLRVRIPLGTGKKKQTQVRNESQKIVMDDRKNAIEASIVRLMKSRQQLEHHKLISEVSAQLLRHFTPDPKAIKQRIEHLITLDYIKRDKNQRNLYVYVA